MNILLLGSGGRECALAWKISQSPLCETLYIAPGNGGTSLYGTNVALSPLDFEGIERFAAAHDISLIVAGNEDPLVAGITDYFAGKGILVLGPTAAGAALEGSKDFAKAFMMRHGIPTAAYRTFTAENLTDGYLFLESLRAPYVLKADGLAAGKGVIITEDLDEAKRTLADMLGGMFGKSSASVVIEEFLSGIECSVFVLTDSNGRYRILPVAKDYKRILEDDRGPNTGGMGAVSPVPFADEVFMKKVEERIIRPTIDGLIAEKIDYRGFIFFGLINVDGEPMVIEYNARMGDPETEAVMPRIVSDIVPLMVAAAKGDLGDLPLEISPEAAATVMLVSKGYPGAYEKGKEMEIAPEATASSTLFHAGTRRDDSGRLLTSGGRVIAVTSMAPTIGEALEKSYAALRFVYFDGKTFRSDIGCDLMR